jgi:hypothetical protein
MPICGELLQPGSNRTNLGDKPMKKIQFKVTLTVDDAVTKKLGKDYIQEAVNEYLIERDLYRFHLYENLHKVTVTAIPDKLLTRG